MEVMPFWGSYALAAQLVLVFFVPPIAYGTRNIFVSDIWCFLWLIPAVALAFQSRRSKNLMRYFAITAIVLGVVYVHGFWRPSVTAGLKAEWLFNLKETDLFQPGRELAIYTRFLSWLWAAGISCWWFSSESSGQKKAFALLIKTLAIVLAGAAFLMLLERLSPSFRTVLSGIYSFDESFTYWRGQAHGPFGSPVEAGMAMALGGLLLIAARSGKPLVGLGVASSLIGVWLTHSATAIAGMGLVGGIFMSTMLPKRYRRSVPLAGAATVLVLLVVLFNTNHFVEGKLRDFYFRASPWRIYFQAMLSRWDYVLLGLGFAPYHCDNSYVFILTRGGLMLFGVFGWFSAVTVRARWQHWPWGLRSVVLFLAITSFALDVLIYRHVVALLIAVGIPTMLRGKKQ